MNKIVIVDSSPIINLIKVSGLDLLKRLYGQIIIPEAVFNEINKSEFKTQANQVKTSYIQIKSIREEERKLVDRLMKNNSPKLHRGESEAIILASEMNADLIIMDDRNGRKVSEMQYGYLTIGAVGIILRSYERGFLDKEEVTQIIKVWKEQDKRGMGPLLEEKFKELSLSEKTAPVLKSEDIDKMKVGDKVEFSGRVVKMSPYTVKTGGVDTKGYSVNLSVDGKGTVNIKTENPAQVELIEKKFRIGKSIEIQGEVKTTVMDKEVGKEMQCRYVSTNAGQITMMQNVEKTVKTKLPGSKELSI